MGRNFFTCRLRFMGLTVENTHRPLPYMSWLPKKRKPASEVFIVCGSFLKTTFDIVFRQVERIECGTRLSIFYYLCVYVRAFKAFHFLNLQWQIYALFLNLQNFFEEILQLHLEIYPAKAKTMLECMKVYYRHRCPITIICRKSEVSAFFKFSESIFVVEKRFFADSNIIHGVNIIVIHQIRNITLRKTKFQDKVFIKGNRLDITKPCVVKPWFFFFTMITYLLLGYRFYFAWRSVNKDKIANL